MAKYRNGTLAESIIPLTVTILDMNDNTPYFELHFGNISEASKAGTATHETPSQPVAVTASGYLTVDTRTNQKLYVAGQQCRESRAAFNGDTGSHVFLNSLIMEFRFKFKNERFKC